MLGRLTPSLLVALLGGGILWQATDGARAFTSEAARRIEVAQDPRPVPDRQLQDMAGVYIPLLPQQGETVLVEFIYTVCGDICQIASGEFAELRNKLRARGVPVRMISVSFDPERDTPTQMADFGELHEADGEIWTIARPDNADLPELLNLFGVVVIPDEWGGFQHNAAIHVLNRDGRFEAVLDIDDVDGVIAHLTGGQG
jgi:protein SCO1